MASELMQIDYLESTDYLITDNNIIPTRIEKNFLYI